MTEENTSSADTEPESSSTLLAGGGAKKVIGKIPDTDGVGVYGYATGSGTTCGVKGEVDASSGYGLATPDDAKIDGTVATTGSHEVNVDGTTGFTLGSTGSDSDGDTAGGNVVSGYEGNSANGNVGVTISGGGSSGSTGTNGSGGSSRPNTNEVTGEYGTVGGGVNNRATTTATVAGGRKNTAGGDGATVAGGANHEASGSGSTVGGGQTNTATASYSTIGGGWQNDTSTQYATVAGGIDNSAGGNSAAVGGGNNNEASGARSTVPGGDNNTASGQYSFAAGRRAKANHDGSFVWADSTDSDFSSTNPDQFLIEVAEGVGINQDNPTNKLHVTQYSDEGGSGLASSYPALFELDVDDSFNEVLALRTGYTGDPGSGTDFLACFDGNYTNLGGIVGDSSGGISFNSGGSDYAEYMPRLDPAEEIEAADVVGVVGDAVTKRTADSDQAMVVSGQAIVTGNSPDPGAEEVSTHETVAFVGQVPAKVRGTVDAGDLVVPSGEHDGTGDAITPGEWRPSDGPIVGRAWESDDTEGVSEVTVAVGIDDPTVFGEHASANSDRIDELEAENERLRKRLAALEDQVAAGSDAGASSVPADD